MPLLALIALLSLGPFPEKSGDARIRVTVPTDVSRAAAAQLTLGTEGPGPILILEGVEVGSGEGLTFSVLAPSSDPHAAPTVLAVTGVVGRSQPVPLHPLTKMKLVVPLNGKANTVVAGKTSVVLTLRMKHPSHGPLHVDKAFFSSAPARQ